MPCYLLRLTSRWNEELEAQRRLARVGYVAHAEACLQRDRLCAGLDEPTAGGREGGWEDGAVEEVRLHEEARRA